MLVLQLSLSLPGDADGKWKSKQDAFLGCLLESINQLGGVCVTVKG